MSKGSASCSFRDYVNSSQRVILLALLHVKSQVFYEKNLSQFYQFFVTKTFEKMSLFPRFFLQTPHIYIKNTKNEHFFAKLFAYVKKIL